MTRRRSSRTCRRPGRPRGPRDPRRDPAARRRAPARRGLRRHRAADQVAARAGRGAERARAGDDDRVRRHRCGRCRTRAARGRRRGGAAHGAARPGEDPQPSRAERQRAPPPGPRAGRTGRRVTRSARAVLLVVGLAGLGVLLVAALLAAPESGRDVHTFADAAIRNSLQQRTPNVISSINFDQRAFDTLIEGSLLFASVLGAVILLRPTPDKPQVEVTDAPEPLDAVRAAGVLLLPVVTLVGYYGVVTGHLSIGGGFQGGVILATGVHLLFLAGEYPALRRVRPLPLVDLGDAAGITGYIAIGLIGVFGGSIFLANTLPLGQFNALFSAGTVDLLNVAVGLEVTSAMVLLLGEFLEQSLTSEGSNA